MLSVSSLDLRTERMPQLDRRTAVLATETGLSTMLNPNGSPSTKSHTYLVSLREPHCPSSAGPCSSSWGCWAALISGESSAQAKRGAHKGLAMQCFPGYSHHTLSYPTYRFGKAKGATLGVLGVSLPPLLPRPPGPESQAHGGSAQEHGHAGLRLLGDARWFARSAHFELARGGVREVCLSCDLRSVHNMSGSTHAFRSHRCSCERAIATCEIEIALHVHNYYVVIFLPVMVSWERVRAWTCVMLDYYYQDVELIWGVPLRNGHDLAS